MYKNQLKILWKFNGQEKRFKMQLAKKERGDKVVWHDRERGKKKRKEKMSYQRHTQALFSTHLVLLKRFRRDDYNHILEYH